MKYFSLINLNAPFQNFHFYLFILFYGYPILFNCSFIFSTSVLVVFFSPSTLFSDSLIRFCSFWMASVNFVICSSKRLIVFFASEISFKRAWYSLLVLMALSFSSPLTIQSFFSVRSDSFDLFSWIIHSTWVVTNRDWFFPLWYFMMLNDTKAKIVPNQWKKTLQYFCCYWSYIEYK